MTDGYGSSGHLPLFGPDSPKEKYINYALGAFASVAVLATVISSLTHPFPPNGVHVFLSFVIILNCISNCLLIYWYREGELDPKFRNLIYYNTLVTILLCIVAFVIIFKHKK
ncbi:transmembrane protein 243-like [Rhopilema esculentum]|uniref:transmembrane protein 243-like n=1 Tax=Rhopilema esculentum TaxID=499914 RepID=UPI0031DFE6F7